MDRLRFLRRRARAFTLLEIALIVAIIGMMMLIIVGYLFAPKGRKAPHPKEANPKTLQSTPTQGPTAEPAAPAPAQPAAAPSAPASGSTPAEKPEAIVIPAPGATPVAPPAFR